MKKTYSFFEKTLKTFVMFLMLLLTAMSSFSQTTLIDPTGDGGFENGSTFASNGWTNTSSANNPWLVGNAVATAPISGNSAYISNDGGVTNAYTPASNASNFFWRDVTVPAGESVINLTFNWMCQGESTWDNWQVFYAPTSVVPVSSTTHPGSGATNVPAGIAGATWLGNGNLQGTVQTSTIYLPASLAGTTFRLIFHWKNDVTGVQPPASIDNISLTSRAQGNYISIATGNYGDASTWDVAAVPTPGDNVTVSAGHVVTINATGQGASDLIVNGTLAYGATPTSFVVNGNLQVNLGGIFNLFNGTTGKTLNVAGNITNNGRINTFVGTANQLVLNGSQVQTVSGTGIFGGTLASTTATNEVDVIRQLICANTNIATPNIIWNVNNIRILGTLNTTGARIALGTNKIYIGNFAAIGTHTGPVGTGFIGGSISRFWTATATGTAITAGTDPTNNTSRYPFLSPTGAQRALYITRSAGGTNTTGYLTVAYTDAASVTTGLTAVDGAYTVTDRADANWNITLENGYSTTTATHTLTIVANSLLNAATTNVRVMNATTFVGTHQNGTTTPGGQRTALTTAQLTGGAFYLGLNSSEISNSSIASGDWNNASIWSKGTVPVCADGVFISPGHTVTVNSAGNSASNTTVSNTGTLVISSGDLTVGCTSNNTPFINNGTLTVSGGTLNINGNLMNNAGSTFNQSGGDIVVDGNDGTTPGSVVTGTPLVRVTASAVSNLNLSGGTITIVDPHFGVSTTDYALSISQGGAANAANPLHTVKFGNGVSTTAGGHSNGFYVYLFPGSFYYSLGNVTVDALTGTNRFVKTTSTVGILGDLTVTSGEYQVASTNIIAGNIVNDGTITATSLLALGTFVPTASISPSANAQSISGTGVFRNLATASTANLTSFQISNSNPAGVTLNVPLSVSGTLTLTAGLVNTTAVNLLSLGTTTAAGTLSGGSSTAYINGPFARTIASGNANSNYINFPVGKSVYNPIWLAPSTTSVSVMKAEVFDSNTGTADASITSLSSLKRWEAPLVSGTITDINVRLSDASMIATNIPVQALTASGVYTNSFGSVATYVAGPPVTVQSNTVSTSANYSGFLSYAVSNACSGTPAPGNTVASSMTICLGSSVNLSLQNVTTGTGVTYQWQSSPDGIAAYTDIALATNATLTVSPTASTFYQCVVTCATGPVSGTSTPVQITFTNSILTTTPGTRCGTGVVSLEATGTPGSTINWYNATSGGTPIGTGSPFVTPSISANTTYYAAAVTAGSNLNGGKLAPEPTWTGSTLTNWGIIFTALDTTILNSVDVYSTAAGTLNVKVTDASGVELYATGNINVAAGGTTTPTVIPLNFNIVQGTTYKILVKASTGVSLVRGSTNLAFPYNNGSVNVTSSEWGGTTTSNYYYFYNFITQSTCSSQRVPVVATVNTAPALTLSAASSVICAGQTSSTVTLTAGSTDYDTYVWSPLTGVTGNSTIGWTFNPSVSTSYTLTASQSTGALCTATATFNVTVNPLPTAITITPASASICADAIQSLVATGGTLNSLGSSTIGTDLTVTTQNGTEPTAFNNRFEHYWMQMVFTASELNAAGVQAGNINGIKFNITTIGSATSVSDYRVYMGNTALNTLTGFVSSGLSEVYAAPTYTQAIGVNSIVFNTPYVWDGISNVIVDVRSTGADSTNNSSTYYTATPDNKTVSSVTSTTFASSNAYVASNPAGTLSLKRLNTTFDWSSSQPVTMTWSPVTNLYTDVAATIPYVAATNATTVYVKSSTAATTTYTATANVTASGCERTATVDVTVTANSSLPTEVVSQCDTYTWSANGTVYTTSGIYTSTTNCVTRTLDLTITTSSSSPTEVVAACDTYTWSANGTVYTTSGIYTSTTNCVTRTLDLTINLSTTTTTNVTVCDSYTWAENGTTYTVGGTYTNVTTNGAGCPNTATLNLVVTNASIDFANLQFPAAATICEGGTITAYGQVYEAGLTEAAGQAAGIDVEFGYNSANTNPNTWTTWTPATFNVQTGNNDEYQATTSNALVGGTYYYTFRYRLSGCSTWQYGGDNNGFWNGTTQNSGVLTINSAATPTGASTQTLNGGVAADVTIEDIVVSGTGIIWYPTLADANAGTNPIAPGTVLTDNTTYYAVSVNGICRSAAFDVLVTVVLETSNFDLSQLNYYPNPVKDIFNVKYNKEIISVDVYDLTGRKVIEMKPNTLEVQLNMTNLSNAMYIVRLQSVDGITELKVYKN